MKVVKPRRLGALTRTVEVAGQCHFAVGALGFFHFDDPDTLLDEVGMWTLAAETLGRDGVLDAAVPKSQGEFLVAGSAWCVGEPRAAADVTVIVGAVTKRVRVVGDRTWRNNAMTEPQPFRSMPVTWERAYGGPSVPANPRGVGAPAREGTALPNVEDPRRMIIGPEDHPPPTGLLPLDLNAPSRMARAGTYDAAWLAHRMPGLADDIDWSHFNIAPEDQWMPDFFRGGETFSVSGMHPSAPVVAGRLPDAVARVFVTLRTPDGPRFTELPMRPETLWLFPEARAGVLIWRGTVRVREDDADDVVHLLVAADRRGERRPPTHFEAVLTERLDPDRGALAALREGELLPPSSAYGPSLEDDANRALAAEDAMRTNLRAVMSRQREELRARLAADGVDLSAFPPLPPEEPPPTIATLPALFEDAERRAEALRADAETRRAEAMRALRETCEAEGVDLDAVTRQPGGPPKFSAEEQIAVLTALAAQSRADGAPAEPLEEMLADPAFVERLQTTEARLREVYVQHAHHLPAASPLTGPAADWARKQVEAARNLGASLAANDLTGADLSGMDLSGMDLRAALLEGANLEDCLLRGAQLEGAVLVRARLEGADLRGARLRGANLARASLVRARLPEADLQEACLVGADLREANLEGASLVGADCDELKLQGASLRRARLDAVLMLRTDLRGADLSDASMVDAMLLEARLDGVDLSRATLTGAVLLGVRAEGVLLRAAFAQNLRAVSDCALEGADLLGADLRGANLRGTRLARAELIGCNLQGADLSRCDLQGARLHRVRAEDSRFERADLRRADLTGANLLRALLTRADLRGADLSGTNLFRADLARARVDLETRFTDALLEQVRVVARLEEP